MEKNIADELSTHLVANNEKLNVIVGELRGTMSESELKPFLEKISHIMTLSFDLLDLVGREYPTLNPYKGHARQ